MENNNNLRSLSNELLQVLTKFQLKASESMSGKDKLFLDCCNLADDLQEFINGFPQKLGEITRGQAISFWSDDTITGQNTIEFVSQIKEYGFHDSVPLDAQAAMRSWANCEPSEENGKYLKAFAEIARLTLGVE